MAFCLRVVGSAVLRIFLWKKMSLLSRENEKELNFVSQPQELKSGDENSFIGFI